jgi:hypothetical protein
MGEGHEAAAHRQQQCDGLAVLQLRKAGSPIKTFQPAGEVVAGDIAVLLFEADIAAGRLLMNGHGISMPIAGKGANCPSKCDRWSAKRLLCNALPGILMITGPQ